MSQEPDEEEQAAEMCGEMIGQPITSIELNVEEGIFLIEHGRGWIEVQGDDLQFTVHLDQMDS